MFSILHISDLHRSHEEPLDNDSLLASLVVDSDRYLGEHPRIPPPEAIVVSGDLIQGVPINTPNWEDRLADQYHIADDFLTKLCDRFLQGNRRAIVLVPGNHDVCWNTSRRAMHAVPSEEYPRSLSDALMVPGSNYRWCWGNQKLYQISDEVVYQQRMSSYWDFIERFYQNVNLPILLDRSRGFHLFEVLDRRVVIAAFESIENNDCFSHVGALSPGIVGTCAMVLRDSVHSYDLKIAVWHHGIQGPPVRSDYMDSFQVQEMTGHGFQLGLHGHQHVSAALTQHVHLDQTQMMAVIGSGSLCAGAKELPRGENRQYNLIVIEDDLEHGRVHVREMGEGGQFTRKRNGIFLNGFLEITWQSGTTSMGVGSNATDTNRRSAIDHAEAALKANQSSEAVGFLQEVNVDDEPYARTLKIAALQSLEEWPQLVQMLESPQSAEEVIILVSALIESGDFDEAEARLEVSSDLEDGIRRGLQERLEARRMMNQP